MSGERILGYREAQVLAVVIGDMTIAGQVRSYQAIADTLGMCSKVAVCNVMLRLERRGLVRRPDRRSRGRFAIPHDPARQLTPLQDERPTI